MFNWHKSILKQTDTMQSAIDILNNEALRIVMIVDDNDSLVGTITDGDIRRGLIKHLSMESLVSNFMHRDPIVATDQEDRKTILSIMKSNKILQIPVVDFNNKIVGLETIQELIEVKKLDNPIFLMAGGFGTRLYPLTKNTPKPLFKVGIKPILETIIEQFINYGFHNFYISIHFESKKIIDYFKNGNNRNINIRYVHEDSPLGTAGSLGLLPEDTSNLPIIVMNGDILTKVDFNNLLDFHNNHNADATMCVREYDFQVPFGVVETDSHKIKKIEEKPVHRFFVNAGIYVLNKDLVSKIDGNSYLDMTDFLEKELDNNGVNAFPVHEYWLDIGRIDEYEQANREVEDMF